EMFHSLMGVPIIKQGRVAGVLTVQTAETRQYAEEEVEVLQTVAMVIAELFTSQLVSDKNLKAVSVAAHSVTISGKVLAEGLARGVAVFHEPKVDIVNVTSENVDEELDRLDSALSLMRQQFDDMISGSDVAQAGETKDILETYKMFAYDRGWQEKITKAIETGLTAEAAVERIQQDLRSKMSQAHDPYLRERLGDLESLSSRLIRVITGHYGDEEHHRLTENSVLIAMNMGPAELLDYDRKLLMGVVLEEGSATSHVTIVAKALGIPVLGRVKNILVETQEHDPIIVDAVAGRVVVRPSENIESTYGKSLGERASLLEKYAAQKSLPSETKDGVKIDLYINAGLIIDLESMHETGADGIGLFRTEFQFMVSATLPRMEEQKSHYSKVLKNAGKKPVVFRTLDIGSDKIVPFLKQTSEENPAMGWRGLRMGLDRPGLLRYQLRALLESAAGKELNIMFPMVSNVSEFKTAKALFHKEVERLDVLKKTKPKRITLGTMIETPSLAWDIEQLLPEVDFVSIGTNDLFQFFFAADRGNPELSGRYDLLSASALRFLRHMAQQCQQHNVPVTICGEMASSPLEAMALIALGIKSFSVSPSSIGPVKMMLRNINVESLQSFMKTALNGGEESLRKPLLDYARQNGIFD
ncbi:MAG: phosphoenolpyruvate--protein phosphotransferase, partial [Sphingomonadales bacterium]|nr:phosphoenolpyruvate--protein phosphotransferase [Sphingomonadales bacterium]